MKKQTFLKSLCLTKIRLVAKFLNCAWNLTARNKRGNVNTYMTMVRPDVCTQNSAL